MRFLWMATFWSAFSSIVWSSTSARAACQEPSSSAEIISALDEAKAAYGDLEVDAFRVAMDRVQSALPCLDEEATRHLSAEVHRFEGLLGFLDRDSTRSQAAFARARGIEPNYRFPSSLVPEGNPVLKEYFAIDPDTGVVRAAEPLSGRLLFDGTTTTMRPVGLPAIFQRMDAEGSVLETVYLWPGDALPAYPASSAEVFVSRGTGVETPDLVGAIRAGPHKGLLVSAGIGLLASGVLYGAAYVVHTRYFNPTTDLSQIDQLRAMNNGLVVASGATFAASVGLGTGAFLTSRF